METAKTIDHTTKGGRRKNKPAVAIHYKTEYCQRGRTQIFSNYAAACHFLAFLAKDAIEVEVEDIWPTEKEDDF